MRVLRNSLVSSGKFDQLSFCGCSRTLIDGRTLNHAPSLGAIEISGHATDPNHFFTAPQGHAENQNITQP